MRGIGIGASSGEKERITVPQKHKVEESRGREYELHQRCCYDADLSDHIEYESIFIKGKEITMEECRE